MNGNSSGFFKLKFHSPTQAPHVDSRMKKSFFNAVSKGLVDELQEMLAIHCLDLMTNLAKSYNEKGETPLLMAIKRSDQYTVKFLVEHLNVCVGQRGRFSWKEFDWLEVPPLFAAIISGQQIVIRLLIQRETMSSAPFTDADSIASSSISRQEKIDVLELMGAAYIFQSEDIANRFGIPCWIQAMNLRYSVEPIIPKIPFHLSEVARKTTGDVHEIATLEELTDSKLNHFNYFIQAILISHRILNPIGLNFFTIILLEHFMEVNYINNLYHLVVNPALFILEEFRVYGWESLTHSQACDIVDSTFCYLTRSIDKLLEKPSVNLGQQNLSSSNLLTAFSFACANVERRRSFLENGESINIRYDISCESIPYLVIWIAWMLPRLSPQEKQEFKRILTRYILKDNKWGTTSSRLLHCVLEHSYYCSKVSFNASPRSSLIQLLLESGADPNTTDEQGNNPLHLIALNWNFSGSRLADAHLLLEAGCHLDHGNESGETALDLFKQGTPEQLPKEGSEDMASFKRLINSVLPLSCLCAQVIQKRRIPFKNQYIPDRLHKFISRHSFSRKRRRSMNLEIL